MPEPAKPHPDVAPALAPLARRCQRMEPMDRFREATSMLEGVRAALTTFAEIRVNAVRELRDVDGMTAAQIARETGLSRARVNQILNDR